MKALTIRCDADYCPNYMVIHGDAPEPKHWLCQPCERHRDELEAEEHARYSGEPPAEFPDKPLMRIGWTPRAFSEVK